MINNVVDNYQSKNQYGQLITKTNLISKTISQQANYPQFTTQDLKTNTQLPRNTDDLLDDESLTFKNMKPTEEQKIQEMSQSFSDINKKDGDKYDCNLQSPLKQKFLNMALGIIDQKDIDMPDEDEQKRLKNDPVLDYISDPLVCEYCNKKFKTEKSNETHFKNNHEKKVIKLEKKLKAKANQNFKSSKKNKLTLNQYKAQIIRDKPKYRLLLP